MNNNQTISWAGDLEVYVISELRSVEFTEKFLDTFLPRRKPTADEYRVPFLSDKLKHAFKSEFELRAFLETHGSEPYALYWDSQQQDGPSQLMLFYTVDNHVVLGAAVGAGQLGEWKEKLMKFAGNEFCLVGNERPPPETLLEFLTAVQEQKSCKP
jgi:hypothetical protein